MRNWGKLQLAQGYISLQVSKLTTLPIDQLYMEGRDRDGDRGQCKCGKRMRQIEVVEQKIQQESAATEAKANLRADR
jgi:hypothetical protein